MSIRIPGKIVSGIVIPRGRKSIQRAQLEEDRDEWRMMIHSESKYIKLRRQIKIRFSH